MEQQIASPRIPTSARIEWPSVILAILIYGSWGCATMAAASMPWWLVLPFGAWLTAWHMSLQHEVIHGHPTRWRWLNDLIGSMPLSLWLPYRRYKRSHLGHHQGRLTDPLEDPESHYVTAERYADAGGVRRLLLRINMTLLGRLTLGPARGIGLFLANDLRALLRGDRETARDWLLNLPGIVLVVSWLSLVCHLSLLRYGMLFVYPGFSLALLRSFAEHRAAEEEEHRTAIVEKTPLLGLLFLHNNLHVVHHARPGLAWYRIPAVYRAERADFVHGNEGLVYSGYREVARRYFVRPYDVPWLSVTRVPRV